MVTKGKMASSTNLAPLSVVFDDLMKHYDMCIEHDTTNGKKFTVTFVEE